MDIYILFAVNIFAIILAVIGIWKVPMSSVFSMLISITVILAEILSGSWSGTSLLFCTVTLIISLASLAVRHD